VVLVVGDLVGGGEAVGDAEVAAEDRVHGADDVGVDGLGV
jgi:hypothetical protein